MTRISFYVGLGDKANDPILKDATEKLLLDNFQGYTTTLANGGWRDPDSGRVDRETSLVISVMAEPKDALNVHNVASKLAALWNQTSVMVTTDNVYVSFVGQVGVAA